MISMILATATQTFAAEAPPAFSTTSDELPFSLTISGGISLGSYEAGVNWALIEFMKKIRYDGTYKKKPELKAITGASAGAINAVMTAMLWLADDKKMAAEKDRLLPGHDKFIARFGADANENILRNAWVAVGIDDLMPKNESDYCNPDETVGSGKKKAACELVDGMFSRKAFEQSKGMITELANARVFRKGKVNIALIASREEPIEVKIGGIPVNNQRFVFMLQFVTDNEGRGHFESQPPQAEYDKKLGIVVYLPHKNNGTKEVDINEVSRLLYASSAFPIAFSKVDLAYCTSEAETAVDAPDRCPDGTYLTPKHDFVDGGLFDNIPLGAAVEIIRTNKTGNEDKSDSENYYFFISPSTRRNVADSFKEPQKRKARTFGLEGMLAFIPGFKAAASDHELFSVLRGGEWQSYDYKSSKVGDHLKLVVTDRYFPITGAFLAHFGAFLDRPFGEFDYSAGVYDAVNNLAGFMLKVYSEETAGKKYGEEAGDIYKTLGLDRGGQASNVFSLIASREHNCRDNQEDWCWIKASRPDKKKKSTMNIIFDSIVNTAGTPMIDDGSDEVFKNYLSQLYLNEYINYGEHSETMKWIMEKHDKDYSVWYSRLVGIAGRRLELLQSIECDHNRKDTLRFVAGGASLVAGKIFNKDEAISVQPHSIPNSDPKRFYYNLLPYELAADISNGGIAISYLGRLKLPVAPLSLDFKLTPIGYNKFGDDRIGFSQADLYLAFNRLSNKYSIGGGPTVNYLWHQADGYHDINIGTAVFFEFFQTVRLTAGLRKLNAERLFGHNYYVTLGIVDIPGIVSRVANNW